jgi:hypothetical protein
MYTSYQKESAMKKFLVLALSAAVSSKAALITNSPPSVSCPAPSTVECATPALITVLASDPDGDALTVVWSLNGAGLQTNTLPASSPPAAVNVSFMGDLPLGTNVIGVTVSDTATNTASCSTTVRVVDTTPPVIAGCPGNITVNTGAGRTTCDQVATWTAPTASDNCALTSFTSNKNPGDTFPVGATTVTYTAKDAAGNSTTCSFNVTVVDTTPPVISGCPGNITVNTGPGRTTCDQVATWTPPTASDNCAVTSFASNKNPGDTFPVGTTTVTYTAKDAAGNPATCSFTVTVVDTTPPVIGTVSANPKSLWPPNHKMVNVTIRAQVTDNCGSATWKIIGVTSNEAVNAKGSGHTSPDWIITGDHTLQLRAERSGDDKGGRIYSITIQATDASGNTSQKVVTVTVPHNK